MSDGRRHIEFGSPFHFFDGIFSPNNSQLGLTMRNSCKGTQASPAMSLRLVYTNPSAVRAYVGKLNWFGYAQGEMVTLVLPHGFSLCAPVCLFFEWTEDASGTAKAAWSGASVLGQYAAGAGGVVRARFIANWSSCFTWDVQAAGGQKTVVLAMSNGSGSRGTYTLNIVQWVCVFPDRLTV